MRGKSVFRPLLIRRSFNVRWLSSSSSSSSSCSFSSFTLKPNSTISTPKTDSSTLLNPYPKPAQGSLHLSNSFSSFSRSLSSAPSSAPPNVVLVKSEEEFNKAQNESKSAIFYFTAAWCGPCRMIAPRVEELAQRYPHVTIYKIDVDVEGLASPLSKLSVHSVPTFHFFQEGKKASEVIGADLTSIVRLMKELYEKKD